MIFLFGFFMGFTLATIAFMAGLYMSKDVKPEKRPGIDPDARVAYSSKKYR